MPIDFTNASFMSVSIENQFLGDDVFNIRGLKTFSIKGIIDTRVSNIDSEGVYEAFAEIQTMVAQGHDYVTDSLIVNGTNFGKGRVTSLSFERENPIRIGEYVAEIQIPYTGDLSNLEGSYYAGVRTAITGNNSHLIEEISETFDFTVGENGNYEYSHDVSLKYISGFGVNPISSAKSVAAALFNTSPAFGFIDAQYDGFYTAAGKKYFTEDYDLINYNFNFSKKFSLLDSNLANYTAHNSRTMDYDGEGNINVTEKGEIVGLIDPIFDKALAGATSEIAGSYSRCESLRAAYDGFANGTALPLNSTSTSVGRELNAPAGKINYTVSYTNNPRIAATYVHEYSLSLSASAIGLVEISENGTVRSFGSKSLSYNGIPTLTSALFNSYSRANAFYNEFYADTPLLAAGQALYNVNSSIDYAGFGGTISYSRNYNNSPATIFLGNLNKVEMQISDKAPVPIKGTFSIPNYKEIIQDAFQTEMGSRNIKITANRMRVLGENTVVDPPDITPEINALKNLALLQAYKIPAEYRNLIINDIYIADCNYGYSNNNTIDFELVVNFVALRRPFDTDPALANLL